VLRVLRLLPQKRQGRAGNGSRDERGGVKTATSSSSRMNIQVLPQNRSGDYKPVVTKEAISLGEPVTGIMFPAWRLVREC
jgi:hypothetical protein